MTLIVASSVGFVVDRLVYYTNDEGEFVCSEIQSKLLSHWSGGIATSCGDVCFTRELIDTLNATKHGIKDGTIPAPDGSKDRIFDRVFVCNPIEKWVESWTLKPNGDSYEWVPGVISETVVDGSWTDDFLNFAAMRTKKDPDHLPSQTLLELAHTFSVEKIGGGSDGYTFVPSNT